MNLFSATHVSFGAIVERTTSFCNNIGLKSWSLRSVGLVRVEFDIQFLEVFYNGSTQKRLLAHSFELL